MFASSTQVPYSTRSQLPSAMQSQPSLPGGVAGQNNFNFYYPGSSSFYPPYSSNNVARPIASQSNPGMNANTGMCMMRPNFSNNNAKPTSNESSPGMNVNYNTYPRSNSVQSQPNLSGAVVGQNLYPYYSGSNLFYPYPSNTNAKPTAIESIREIKRHLALLETPTNDAKPKQAEINLLISEIKPKVNSLESAIKRDDFDYLSSKLDYLLKQIELNTSRPSFGELSNFQLQSYLISDGDAISALGDLLDRNVFSQKIDSQLKFMQNNSNRIIALLAAQLDCILSIKSNQYFCDIYRLHNFNAKVVSNIEAILSLISKVLNCLEHSKDILADETLSKLMEKLLPLKMLETKKKSQLVHTLYNPTSSASIKSILASALFWSASKWFVSPSALLAMSLKLIRELTFEASATNNSSVNKYLFLSKIHDFVCNNEEQSKNLALETFCYDFGLLIKQMSNAELDKTRLDVILLDIYSLSQHDPGFQLLKSSDADVAMFNLINLITKQFGERIWCHFALVDREIEKQSAQLGDSNKVWLLDYLKSVGFERKKQTCKDSSKISTLVVPTWPDLRENDNENIIKEFQKMKDDLNKKIVDIEKLKKTIDFNE